MFYKAAVQTVLLYGSETWVLSPDMLAKLEAFHRRIAKCLTGRDVFYLRRERHRDCSPLGNTMKEAGLWPLEEYITRRRNRLVDFVVTRPLFALCKEAADLGLGKPDQYPWSFQIVHGSMYARCRFEH
jgi:hypothetical protein